jgi:hypothetical protein
MNWRISTFSILGIVCVPFAYYVYVKAFERVMMPAEWHWASVPLVDDFHDRKGMAPVELYADNRFPEKRVVDVSVDMEWRHLHALQIVVVKGQAFAGDELIPLDQITHYVNETKKEDIDYVIVTPSRGSTWNSIFPVLDACRRSTVVAVLLNRTSSI